MDDLTRQEKLATSEMFERETRREKVLEAFDLNREMQLRQRNKTGLLNLLGVGNIKKFSKETEEKTTKVDSIEEAEKEFYRIINEVSFFQFTKLNRKVPFDVIKYIAFKTNLLI